MTGCAFICTLWLLQAVAAGLIDELIAKEAIDPVAVAKDDDSLRSAAAKPLSAGAPERRFSSLRAPPPLSATASLAGGVIPDRFPPS